MPFVEISGKNIRNLKEFSLLPSDGTNLIYGSNGAGKTSILEAVYLNGLGRSFKTSALSNIINENESSCFVFSRFVEEDKNLNHKIGVERLRGNKQKIKVDGALLGSLAPLAFLIPIITILPTETSLVDNSSSVRRKYLDWIMFHVEPGFFELWKNHQKLLKHRNHLLRNHGKRNEKSLLLELSSWDQQFIEANKRISDLRGPVCEELFNKTLSVLSELPAYKAQTLSFEVSFYKGWSHKEGGFENALSSGFKQDLKVGFSRLGAHRSDIVIKANQHPAKEYLSNGQKKLLSIAMKLAQAVLLRERQNKKAVLLIDDLFAELDEKNAEKFVALIEQLGLQTFFTSTDSQPQTKNWFKKRAKVFHVEQGLIEEV